MKIQRCPTLLSSLSYHTASLTNSLVPFYQLGPCFHELIALESSPFYKKGQPPFSTVNKLLQIQGIEAVISSYFLLGAANNY